MTDTTPAVDKVTFESPINLEGSWGGRNLAQKATSTMELWFHKDGSGFIEWCVDELDIVEGIGLQFEYGTGGKRTLVDYDGVMTLPDQAMDLLEKHGVDCTEMRQSLA